MSLTPNKTQINYARLVVSKNNEDEWGSYYIQCGKLWRLPLAELPNTYNDVTAAVRYRYPEGAIRDATSWVEVTDPVVVGFKFFRMSTGIGIDSADFCQELSHFGEGTEAVAASQPEQEDACAALAIRFPKYWKGLPALWKAIDTYRVNELFPIVGDDSGRLLHARKKLLVPGTRTGGKSLYVDIAEAHATLGAWLADNKPEQSK